MTGHRTAKAAIATVPGMAAGQVRYQDSNVVSLAYWEGTERMIATARRRGPRHGWSIDGPIPEWKLHRPGRVRIDAIDGASYRQADTLCAACLVPVGFHTDIYVSKGSGNWFHAACAPSWPAGAAPALWEAP